MTATGRCIGALLAGGKSRRMGTTKAAIQGVLTLSLHNATAEGREYALFDRFKIAFPACSWISPLVRSRNWPKRLLYPLF